VLIYSAGEARGKVCPMSETRSSKAPWVFLLVKMLMMLSVNNPKGLFLFVSRDTLFLPVMILGLLV
jgi:hypothetical protein